MVRLRGLLEAPIVTVSGQAWTGRALVTAGVISGRWPQLEAELAAGMAARRKWEPPDDAVKDRLRTFRYERRLVSAAEFTAWMRARELTQADLLAAVERRLAREHDPGADTLDLTLARETATAALPAEAVYTGALADCARWLVDGLLCIEPGQDHAPAEAEIDGILSRERELLVGDALAQSDEERRARAALLLSAASAYESHAAAICTPDAVSAQLRRHALDWLRFDVTCFTSPAQGPAAEVAALLKEGTVPDRIRELSGLPTEVARLSLEEAPETIRGQLASATAGAVLGPVLDRDVHRTWLIDARLPPASSEAEITARARAEIVEADMHRRRAGAVRWHERH